MQRGLCTTRHATLALDPNATTLAVGQPLTVALTRTNQGCAGIGLSLYRLALASVKVHLGYPGPAYWSGRGAGPLAITVTL